MSGSNWFETHDNASLHYLEAGSGSPLVLLPGWSQSAAMFAPQIDTLCDRYRCLAIDHRGHGESHNIAGGYRVSRLAMDLREFLLALDLEQVTLLGHSMGAAVIFAYFELFGSDRVAAVIIDDQPAALTVSEAESAEARRDAGAIFTFSHLNAVCDALRGADAEETTRRMLTDMFSTQLTDARMEWLLAENLKLPRQHAATLLWDCALADWREVIGRINVPALVIGGKASLVPWESQRWIAQQIPAAECHILEEPEGGYHFAFLEQPKVFGELLAGFLTRQGL